MNVTSMWNSASRDLRKKIIDAVDEDRTMSRCEFECLPERVKEILAKAHNKNPILTGGGDDATRFLECLNYLYAKEKSANGSTGQPLIMRTGDTFLKTWRENGMREPSWAD